MLSNQLLSHQWKSFIRNAQWRRGIATKILFAILALYVIAVFAALGMYINEILAKAGGNPIDTFNSALLWYLAADLITRIFFQPLPVLKTLPYLQFRIRKRQIINYLIGRSFWNGFNILPWLVVVPFALKLVFPAFGILATVSYLFLFACFVAFNNLLAAYIGFLAKKNSLTYIIPFVLVLFLLTAATLGISISNISTIYGQQLLYPNVVIVVLLGIASNVLLWHFRTMLAKHFYIDSDISENKKTGTLIRMESFTKLAETGRYMALELNMLLRNKRSRQSLLMLPILIVYMLVINSRTGNQQGQFFELMALVITGGIGAAIYGQFLFSWESASFDGLMARKLDFTKYVTAKYYIMLALSVIGFLPACIVFALQHKFDVSLMAAVLLFCIGPNAFVIAWIASFNDGRIDLGKGQFFNYQGVKGSQFLLSFIFMLLPIGIYLLFEWLLSPLAGTIALAFPGLLFLAFHNWWIQNIVVENFMTRKYKNLEGYRKLSV